jgi:hypothetical protein
MSGYYFASYLQKERALTIPVNSINLIMHFAAEGKWFLVISPDGKRISRRVCEMGYNEIHGVLSYKIYAMERIIQHSILYNDQVIYRTAITYEHPPITSYNNDERHLCFRHYTCIEIGPNQYDYVYIRQKYRNGEREIFQTNHLYRPHAKQIPQLLHGFSRDKGALLSISFTKFWNGIFWTGETDYAEPIEFGFDDEEEIIDWAD